MPARSDFPDTPRYYAPRLSNTDNLGEFDMLGSLEPGKFGDPLADVTELEDVDFVMKEGVAYKAP